MEEVEFQEFYRRVVDSYELSPEVASDLLREILISLKKSKNAHLQMEVKYEILLEYMEREE